MYGGFPKENDKGVCLLQEERRLSFFERQTRVRILRGFFCAHQ